MCSPLILSSLGRTSFDAGMFMPPSIMPFIAAKRRAPLTFFCRPMSAIASVSFFRCAFFARRYPQRYAAGTFPVGAFQPYFLSSFVCALTSMTSPIGV